MTLFISTSHAEQWGNIAQTEFLRSSHHRRLANVDPAELPLNLEEFREAMAPLYKVMDKITETGDGTMAREGDIFQRINAMGVDGYDELEMEIFREMAKKLETPSYDITRALEDNQIQEMEKILGCEHQEWFDYIKMMEDKIALRPAEESDMNVLWRQLGGHDELQGLDLTERMVKIQERMNERVNQEGFEADHANIDTIFTEMGVDGFNKGEFEILQQMANRLDGDAATSFTLDADHVIQMKTILGNDYNEWASVFENYDFNDLPFDPTTLIIVLVAVGVALLGGGGYCFYKRRHGNNI